MSKIVQAVNVMISNKRLIDDVVKTDMEIFFRYHKKYIWSIRLIPETSEYLLWYYPGAVDVQKIAMNEIEEWNNVPMMTYSTKDIGTKEARASFAELHNIAKERLFGMDEVLEDIISDSEEF